VGGAVRGLYLGIPPKDWDLATEATPDQVSRIFKRVIPTGIKHGTVTVLDRGNHYEITTFRTEGKYSDFRRPDSINFTASLEEDLKRRDFTVNAMAVDIESGVLFDPNDGARDCRDGIIRALGNPEERFNEDGLRILRAVRFSGQLNFTIETRTFEGMKACSSNLEHISRERIRDELEKILKTETPSKSFLIMDRAGILAGILPELTVCKTVAQKGNHKFDVFYHSLYSCDGTPGTDAGLRLAALFHDIGKPLVVSEGANNIPSFHGHEEKSAETASKILKRLKFPLVVENRVCHLIRHHMFNYDSTWTDAAVRRFLRRTGAENFEDLILLRLADQYGTDKVRGFEKNFDELRLRVSAVLSQETALSLKDLKVDGDDLQEFAGIPKGRNLGQVLDFLLEAVLEDPAMNERENLLRMARNFYVSRLK
jgi:tRNA nucleotidyltransferase/poly(A) polymerase